MDEIYQKAWTDYLKLVELVRGFNGDLDQICEHLKGWNLDHLENKFDCNFGSLTATIYSVENELFVFHLVDVWDDKELTLVKENIDYTDLKSLAEKMEVEKGGDEA